MADVNTRARDTDLLDTMSKLVVMGGAMSAQLQAADLSVDAVETKHVRLQSG